jgi:hypothetical protein
MNEQFIPLADMDAFHAFWDENGDALSALSKDDAFLLACNCELIVGGGAAPLFRVGFVDDYDIHAEERSERRNGA